MGWVGGDLFFCLHLREIQLSSNFAKAWYRERFNNNNVTAGTTSHRVSTCAVSTGNGAQDMPGPHGIRWRSEPQPCAPRYPFRAVNRRACDELLIRRHEDKFTTKFNGQETDFFVLEMSSQKKKLTNDVYVCIIYAPERSVLCSQTRIIASLWLQNHTCCHHTFSVRTRLDICN